MRGFEPHITTRVFSCRTAGLSGKAPLRFSFASFLGLVDPTLFVFFGRLLWPTLLIMTTLIVFIITTVPEGGKLSAKSVDIARLVSVSTDFQNQI